jgi:hypothetical protein
MKKLTTTLAFVLHSVAGLLLLSIPSQAHADFFYDKKLTADDLRGLNAVRVSLRDGANGACWTNLKEVREYAEEKLRIKGMAVTDINEPGLASEGTYWLSIVVHAKRVYENNTGPCVGSLSASLVGVDYVGEWINAITLAAIELGVTIKKDNFNRVSIEMISQFFDKFPE